MQLWSSFMEPANFMMAWDQVRTNNGVAGIDGVSCLAFADRLAVALKKLMNELEAGIYQTAPLKPIMLHLPDDRTRTLLIPTVRDRVAQTALHLVLLPRLEAGLADCTFAYRPGLSHHDAVKTVGEWRHWGYEWVVDADITRYFDEVPHDLLIDRLRVMVPEDRILSLVRQWLAAPVGWHPQAPKRTKGLPQGSPISPILSNLFLDKLDEALLAENLKLVRFADDFVILCKSQNQALSALALTVSVLDELELSLHPEKTRIAHFNEGFQFLGHLFLRSLILPLRSKKRLILPTTTPIEHLIRTKDKEKADHRVLKSLDLSTQPTPETPWPLPSSVAIGATPDTTLADALSDALAAKGLTLTDFKTDLPEMPPLSGGPTPKSPMKQDRVVSNPPAFSPLLPTLPQVKGTLLLRTLYLHEQGAWLQVEGDRFKVTKSREQVRETLLDIPQIKVAQVVVFGGITISPAAIRLCLLKNIPITYLSVTGKYYGRLEQPDATMLDRRRSQFRLSEDEERSLKLARAFVQGKLINQRMYLQRLHQEHPQADMVEAIQYIGKRIRRIPGMKTTDMLRGLEGLAAHRFYAAWATCIRQEGMPFTHRQRRPPPDPVNALLSFGYTLLYQNMISLLCIHRLDPYMGILHAERSGHAALASDLMEEFRFLIDRLVLRLINKNNIQRSDFFISEDEYGQTACYLKPDARKAYIRAFEELMQTPLKHPRLRRTVTYRQAMEVQVQYFVRALQQEEPYLPFRIPK